VSVTLRPAVPEDIELFFRLQQDPVAAWMAAFTSDNLSDRTAFEKRWQRILADHTIVVKTILLDSIAVGQVLKYVAEGRPEVSYWLARDHWGQGHATEAVRLLLDEITERPISARVAQDNAGSISVLRRNGFSITGQGSGPAAGRGAVVREYVLTLE
jgi:RimJ/RimL family protein N-acetyltransferase